MSQHRAPIQHPGSLGANNKHLLDSLATAYRAALDLAERGIDVLSVQAGWRNPIIYISHSPLCDEMFDAATKVRYLEHRRRLRRTKIMVAAYRGCQVQWRV